MNIHYTVADLRRALDNLPLQKGDTLFVHSNIGFFGRMEGVLDSQSLCEIFFDALIQRVGYTGTIVVPTFTYSFPRQQIFCSSSPASDMGVFSEWVRLHPDSRRSIDPSYSVAAIGRLASFLTVNVPDNSFQPNGFFGRFLAHGGVVLNLNFDAGSTFIHYLEREFKVPYRFDKTFEGYIKEGERLIKAKNTIYVRYLSDNSTEASFEEFHKIAVKKGVFTTQLLGRGQIGSIRSTECRHLLKKVLVYRPWILTKAEKLGIIPELKYEANYIH